MENKYYYAKGRRKTSIATVRLYEGDGETLVNDKPIKEYFKLASDLRDTLTPLKVTDLEGKMYFTAKVIGGGVTGQSGAIVHALSRALVKYDADLKKILKTHDLITRDNRMVERKHTGLRKARKAPQFSKR